METVTFTDLLEDKQRTLISVQQAAQLFGVHPNTVYRHIRSGDIPTLKIGRQYRIDVNTLRERLRGA